MTPEHTQHIEAAEITPAQARETADDMYFADEHEWPARARKTIVSLADQVEVLTKERDAAVKLAAERLVDAENYQWLRAQNWHDGPMCVVMSPATSLKLGCYCPSLELLDDAIRAAKAAS